jgi:hypothetical protein
MVDSEMSLDSFDIVGHRLADDELRRRFAGRRSGGTEREKAYIAAAIDNKIRVKVLVEMVLVADSEFESTLKVARKFGDTDKHCDVSFGASIPYGYLAMMNEWPQERAPDGLIFGTGIYGRREQQLPTTQRRANR